MALGLLQVVLNFNAKRANVHQSHPVFQCLPPSPINTHFGGPAVDRHSRIRVTIERMSVESGLQLPRSYNGIYERGYSFLSRIACVPDSAEQFCLASLPAQHNT